MTRFECLSVVGYAGDRSPVSMQECHKFAKAFSKYFNFPNELVGSPVVAKDLAWDAALQESRETFQAIGTNLNRIYAAQRSPIFITPRCASAIASLPVVIAQHPDVVVLYFDAHGDLNTPESSTSGNLGGMPLTAVLGEWDSGYGSGLKVGNLLHIGGRDFDPAEEDFIEKFEVNTISKDEIEGDLTRLRTHISARPVFVHLDTDVFDPSVATADYSVADGLLSWHVAKIVDIVLAESSIVGLEITEFAPRNNEERETTYTTIFSAFYGLRELP